MTQRFLSYEQRIKNKERNRHSHRRRSVERREKRQREEVVRMAVLDRIPDNYPDLFPLAREMRRHFVLHLGGTNSGKTYDAVQAMLDAGSGVYLGPLRLLAYEQYESINAAGYPCSLVTGEERQEKDGAMFRASTIEMLDTHAYYNAAVIDEAQMVSDPDRGGAWTTAILGVLADEIHICAAPEAEDRLVAMIEECGDTYEFIDHERMTPLIFEDKPFELRQDVQEGDALIVFSRKNVHAVAAELQKLGFRCSVVYGALPYDVRHEQARLFAEGLTDVVVATDAIGMGMNLPIRRVVFLEARKFNGRTVSSLTSAQIKQIAGRAGRYGIYDEGYVAAAVSGAEIRRGLEVPPSDIGKATIGFPETLLGIDAPLSVILKKWAGITVLDGYKREDTERMITLCRILEPYTNDKRLLYDCLTIAFDEKDQTLLAVWTSMCKEEIAGKVFPVKRYLAKASDPHRIPDDLDRLEFAFRLRDLLYGYCDKFHHTGPVAQLMREKAAISKRIIKILQKQKLTGRQCRSCGRPLPWSYPYGICQRCYDRGAFLNSWSER